FHLNLPLASHHSITSSASANNLSGISRPSAFASPAWGEFGLTSTIIAIAAALGIIWRSSSSRFVPDALVRKLTPVAFPPGRLRLATKPCITGSPPVTNTIGTVVFADFAASAEGVFPTIKATCWRTKSATRAGNRWSSCSAERYSTMTFWPSMKPTGHEVHSVSERGVPQEPNHRHRRLLRARRERPRRRAAEQRDEVASLHSINSSATASSVGGTASHGLGAGARSFPSTANPMA